MSENKRALWHGGGCYVPRTVAECPECQGELTARAMQWDGETGQPSASAIDIECIAEMNGRLSHRWHQSDWQPIRDAIAKWCGARIQRTARSVSIATTANADCTGAAMGNAGATRRGSNHESLKHDPDATR